MVREAATHAEQDRRRRALAEVRNQAESLVHATEGNLAAHGAKLEAKDKTEIEASLAALRGAIVGEDAGQIEAAHNALIQVSGKLAEAAYKTEAHEATDGQAEGTRAADGDDRVVDAEFEDVDGRKPAS
jgi:molecular chaperone DnaK